MVSLRRRKRDGEGVRLLDLDFRGSTCCCKSILYNASIMRLDLGRSSTGQRKLYQAGSVLGDRRWLGGLDASPLD